MDVSDFLLANMRLCHDNRAVSSRDVRCPGVMGWDRATKRLFPTLARQSEDEAWGFSASTGSDVGEWTAHWSGVAARRNDKGIWLKVSSVRSDSPAASAGLRPRDFITRINGQVVFHLDTKDVERLIRESGKTLLLDIERDSARTLLYDGGIYGSQLNFLYNDYQPVYSHYPKKYA